MPHPRFRLKSLMILILLAGLTMGAGLQISRMDPDDIEDLKQRIFLLSPFLVLVLAKFGLIVAARSRRWAVEAPTKLHPVDELECDEIPS
jgi:hypothetical protein